MAPRLSLPALLFAVFVTALGYGIVLPVLPLIVQRLTGTSEPAVIARHTAFITAIFAAAPLAAAYPWGRCSDRIGRRPILVVGLVGFGLTLAASGMVESLPVLYAIRLLNGGFAATIVPAALAYTADSETDEYRRVRRFSWISMASIIGFLAGPMLGGVTARWDGLALAEVIAFPSNAVPFLLAASLAMAGAMAACTAASIIAHRWERRS
ncbi:MFS transporter [Inquilinus sp. OTU3971]|uniref:MFS transporter n=1 Tax=Inquilinus sp. OTU3971 TaxID=3043855 RepID=UPI00313DDDC9